MIKTGIVFDDFIRQRYPISDNMMMNLNRVLCVQLFILIPGKSFAWDGCLFEQAWRCGATCIVMSAECKCGDEIFGLNDQKWCCHNSCTGKGSEDESGHRFGGIGRTETLMAFRGASRPATPPT